MQVQPDTDRDAVVIGGGVIGLAIAYELAKRGRRVEVLERSRIGHGSTHAAAGMLAPVSEADHEPPEQIAFGMESLERYPSFVAEIEKRSGIRCHLRPAGALWVATTRDDLAELDHLADNLAQKGLVLKALTGDQLLALEPHLSNRVLAGLRVEKDRQVDPRALARALAGAGQDLGVEYSTGVTVERVAPSGSRVVLSGRRPDGRFTIRARDVVVAAGAWSGQGLHPALDRAGVRPVKGQIVRLRGPVLLQQVVRTPDVYLIPRSGGELLVGATMEEMGFGDRPTGGAVMDLLRHGWQVLPGIYDLEFVEVAVGLRPAVRDHLPAIGPTAVQGLWAAFGHYRNGVLLAPATAHHLAEWITTGQAPVELAPFSPARLDLPPSTPRPAATRTGVVQPEESA